MFRQVLFKQGTLCPTIIDSQVQLNKRDDLPVALDAEIR
jgi:hypothetical protein